jgi:hypothetical protein
LNIDTVRKLLNGGLFKTQSTIRKRNAGYISLHRETTRAPVRIAKDAVHFMFG